MTLHLDSHLDSPATGTSVRAIPYELSGDLPLTVSPRSESPRARDLGALCDWLRENRTWVEARLTEHGALRFRGFAVDGQAARLVGGVGR